LASQVLPATTKKDEEFPSALTEEVKCRILKEKTLVPRPWLEVP
jgi:hypothetical protein